MTTNTHRRGIRPILTLQQELDAAAERRERLGGIVAWSVGILLIAGIAVLGFCTMTGCGGIATVSSSRSQSDECRYHDDSFIAWQAVTVASSSLGAAVAGGGVVSEVVGDAEGAVIGLSVSGAVLGALALVGSLLSSHHAARYGEECSGPTVSPETPP